jgi:hypothetical protein
VATTSGISRWLVTPSFTDLEDSSARIHWPYLQMLQYRPDWSVGGSSGYGKRCSLDRAKGCHTLVGVCVPGC